MVYTELEAQNDSNERKIQLKVHYDFPITNNNPVPSEFGHKSQTTVYSVLVCYLAQWKHTENYHQPKLDDFA